MPVEPNADEPPLSVYRRRRRGVWAWLAIALLLTAIGLAVAAEIMLKRAGPILKGRVIDTLSTRFNARVELDTFRVSVVHGIDVSGTGLRIFPPDDVVAVGDTAPLIAIREFTFHTGLRGLFVKPTHIGEVHISGMTVSIPPRQMRQRATARPHRGKIQVVVDTLLFDDSHVILQPSRPNKDPKDFVLQHIVMHDLGPARPLHYDATLVNAIPRGDIEASGALGPWNTETPGDSAVSGSYTFSHADLNTIHGIGGTLHSSGSFGGQLDRIDVQGATETPDFSLDTANHAMALSTTFHAIVDGTSGDTYLQPVQARLGGSSFTCKGAVVNVRGQGHIIDLDVTVPNGRIEDFLRLSVKSDRPIMTARLAMHSTIHIPPGPESVPHRLELKSAFTLREIHFTDPATEDRIDELSLRAQGRPDEAKPGADDVHSTMSGDFVMDHAHLRFSRLDYGMPGGEIRLTGTYALSGERFDFTGHIRTDAKLSQMVSTWWKSWLLKPVDPFFHRNGAGAEIPVRISGTKDHPSFGLDLGH